MQAMGYIRQQFPCAFIFQYGEAENRLSFYEAGTKHTTLLAEKYLASS